MKWFRHFSNASTSLKLNGLIDKLGLKGYGQYWLLIELLNEKFDGFDASSIMVHQSELLTSLRVRYVGTLGELLGNMKGLDLLDYSRDERVYSFNCPMLFDLMDKDSKYNKRNNRKTLALSDQPANNRYKIKELEEEVDISPTPLQNFDPRKHLNAKKILSSDSPQENLKKVYPRFTPDHVVQAWNESMGKEFGYCPGLGGGAHRDNCLESISYLPDQASWESLFQKCRESDFLTGKGKSTWTVNLIWLVNYDNALKVLSDNFDENKAMKNLSADAEAILRSRGEIA